MQTANVLGVEYTIKITDEAEEPYLKKVDGFCDTSTKQIFVRKSVPSEDSLKDLDRYTNQVMRHELVHAFLFEGGLSHCSDWAADEELVDWIALQFPKLSTLFKQLDIM